MKIAAALVIGVVWITVSPIGANAAPCPDNPLAGLEQGRWTVIDKCRTVSGEVLGIAPSSGGAHWLILRGGYWAKVYPDRGLPMNIRPGQTITVTGALVLDATTPQISGWELVPVASIDREPIDRQYNESRTTGWWEVTRWADGHYSDWPLMTSDYAAAGIR